MLSVCRRKAQMGKAGKETLDTMLRMIRVSVCRITFCKKATLLTKLGFTTDMLAFFNKNFCIDTSRVYATGKSNGGGFVGNVLACDPTLSKVFAAFAPVVSTVHTLSKSPEQGHHSWEKVPATCPLSLSLDIIETSTQRAVNVSSNHEAE